MAEKKDKQRCSFCGRTDAEAGPILVSPSGGSICKDCADLCQNIFNENKNGKENQGVSEKISSYIQKLKVPSP